MKIGIDISQVVYKGSGVESYTRNLINSMVEQSPDEFVFFGSSLRQYHSLQTFYQNIKKNKNIDYCFLHIPQTILKFIWNNLHVFNIESFIGRTDIFHTSDWIEPPSKIPKVTTIHDLVVLKYPEFSDSQIVSTQKKRLSWVKKDSNVIISDSESTKKDIIDYLDINPSKIVVIYPGVDNCFIKKNQIEINKIKAKYNISGDYVLSVGTQEPRKNIAKIIQAFAQFINSPLIENKDIKLVLVGKYGWGDKLFNPPHFVKVLGFVDSEDLSTLYSGASIFVYPSLYEGFGLPILEAMACGTVVITSDRGSLREVGGDVALYINPEDEKEIGNKMVNLLIDREKREKIKKEGIIWVKQFNWKNTAKKTLEIYKELVTRVKY